MCKTEQYLKKRKLKTEENQESYRLEEQKPQKILIYKQLNIK